MSEDVTRTFQYITLEHHPEIASQLGIVLANMSHMDAFFFLAFRELLNFSDELAHAVLNRIESSTPKFQIVMDAARLAAPGDHLAETLLKHEGEIRPLRKLRNQIAHANFVRMDNGEIHAQCNAFSTRDSYQHFLVTADDLARAAKNAIFINRQIDAALKRRFVDMPLKKPKPSQGSA